MGKRDVVELKWAVEEKLQEKVTRKKDELKKGHGRMG